ncbi:MAG: hypothetical protein IH944_05745 [Armatimonadetes bacterium]|nr:hypothetical protein [Armatimonadota bacterium]
MSVTTFLRDKEVVARFKEFVTVPRVPDASILVPSTLDKSQASLTGTAFDYLMRYTVKRLYPTTAVDRRWEAEGALHYLNDKDARKAKATIDEALIEFRQYSNGAGLTPRLCELSVLLGRLDVVFRTGRYTELVGKSDPVIVKELLALAEVIDLRQFKGFERVYLNPTFGMASNLIEGADADIILDDLLVEVKTTKRAGIQATEIYQLLCYVLLCEIGGLGNAACDHRLSRIGIYRSRHACLTTWPVEDVVDMTQYDAFLEWFKKAIGAN